MSINQKNDKQELLETLTWERVQERLGDIPGKEGIFLRQKEYKKFFLGLGNDVIIHENCRFYHPDRIVLEDNVRINIGALVYGSGGVKIGRNVLIGPRFFLHSANHDISPGPLAFFERGYQYEYVIIGDNSLISSNVSIMPGARLGSGSFVAANALVKRGQYPDQSDIRGMPANQINTHTEQVGVLTLSAALIVPDITGNDGIDYFIHSRALLEVLGIAQIAVVRDGESVENYKSIFYFGPDGWVPQSLLNSSFDKRSVWSLGSGNLSLKGNIKVQLPKDGLSIPGFIKHKWVPSLVNVNNSRSHQANVSLYYAIKRLKKNVSEFSDTWVMWLLLASVLGESAAKKGIESAFDNAISNNELLKLKLLNKIQSDKIDVKSYVIEHVDSMHINYKVNVKSFLANPVFSIKAAFSSSKHDREGLVSILKEAIGAATKTHQIASFSLSAYFIHEDDLFVYAEKRLKEEFSDNQTDYYKSAITSTAYCYEPSLAAFLILLARQEDPGFIPQCSIDDETNLSWTGFLNVIDDFYFENSKSRIGFVDFENYKIDRSVFENWIALGKAPEQIKGFQYELTDANYSRVLNSLEAVWLEIFKRIFRSIELSLLIVKPWPYPYHSALSLRYDIDRPLNSKQITEIIDLQKKYFNRACASWYFFSKDSIDTPLRRRLKNNLQELAIHIADSTDPAVQGVGVTSHSAPDSEYWLGSETITNCFEQGAKYVEMLSAQCSVPRRYYLNDNDSIWITPIHFPMEGQVNNTGLNYFDLRLEDFHNAIKNGGHIILGSHQDVDQSHFKELFDREDFSGFWCETVENVIQRVSRVVSYGAIKISISDENKIHLLSENTISDLQVCIYSTNGEIVNLKPIQLNAKISRTVDMDAVISSD